MKQPWFKLFFIFSGAVHASRRWDLNPRPADYESAALTSELRRPYTNYTQLGCPCLTILRTVTSPYKRAQMCGTCCSCQGHVAGRERRLWFNQSRGSFDEPCQFSSRLGWLLLSLLCILIGAVGILFRDVYYPVLTYYRWENLMCCGIYGPLFSPIGVVGCHTSLHGSL